MLMINLARYVTFALLYKGIKVFNIEFLCHHLNFSATIISFFYIERVNKMHFCFFFQVVFTENFSSFDETCSLFAIVFVMS